MAFNITMIMRLPSSEVCLRAAFAAVTLSLLLAPSSCAPSLGWLVVRDVIGGGYQNGGWVPLGAPTLAGCRFCVVGPAVIAVRPHHTKTTPCPRRVRLEPSAPPFWLLNFTAERVSFTAES